MLSDGQLAIIIGLAVILIFTVAAIAIVVSRGGATDASVSGSLAAIDVRVTTVESRLRSMEERENKTGHDVANIRTIIGTLPSNKELSAVLVEVAETKGIMQGVMEGVRTTGRTVERMEEFMLELGARGLSGEKEREGS